MIDEEQVKIIVKKALDEEHLTGFIKIFEKEHNIFRGSHDKIGLPENIVIHQTIVNHIINKTTIDQVADGTTYGKIALSALSEGMALLSEAVGTLDDISDGTYAKILATSLSEGKALLSQATGTLDDIVDGTYAKALATSLDEGKILLSQALGSLDSIANGTTYGRVLLADLSGGHIILGNTVGDLDDVDDGTNYGKILLTDISAGHILLASAEGDLDDVDDGISYAKVLATDISAGHILLSEASGDLDDIANGVNYGRVAVTDISAGHILLATCEGDLDNIDDGSTYGRILSTDIQSGHIKLTECVGTLDSISPCDATTDWTASAGGSLSIDTGDKKEGSGSLKNTIAAPAADSSYDTKYNPTGSWDWSAKKHILFWLKCDRPSTAFTYARFYIHDTSGNWRYWNLTFSAGEWTAVKKLLSTGDVESGTPPDLALINYVRIMFTTADTTPFYKKIDYLRVIGIGTLDDIGEGITYGRVAITDISAGHILLATCDGDLDDISEGISYGKVLVTSLSAGKILLSEAEGSLDNIANGTSYGRVAITDIQAGHILLATCDGDLDDIDDGIYGKVLSTDIQAGHIRLSECSGTLDDVANGTTYGRVAVTDISAGHILLATCDGDLDDVAEGTNYGKVLVTDISAGHIVLATCEGDLDDIGEGTIYGRVLVTDISAGHIKLSAVVEDDTHKILSGTEQTKLGGIDANADVTANNPQAVSWLTDAGALAAKDAVDLATAEVVNKVLDNIGDGITYARVLNTDITAGHILLSACTGNLDNIGNGATYGRVNITAISAGNIVLSTCEGDLDDIANGDNYGKVALTSISAGKIIVAGLDSGITDRMFEDLATKDNIEAWRRAEDVTMIDGGKIYAKSITADQILAGTITADEIHAGTITADNLVAGLQMKWTSMPSTTARNTNAAEKTTSSATYVKLKEMKINVVTGKMNVRFGLLATEGTPKHVEGKIYKNDLPIGIERSTSSVVSWVYFEEEIDACDVDDRIQIYVKKSGVGQTAKVKDMALRYDRAVSLIVGQTLTTPLPTVDQTIYSVTNQDP